MVPTRASSSRASAFSSARLARRAGLGLVPRLLEPRAQPQLQLASRLLREGHRHDALDRGAASSAITSTMRLDELGRLAGTGRGLHDDVSSRGACE